MSNLGQIYINGFTKLMGHPNNLQNWISHIEVNPKISNTRMLELKKKWGAKNSEQKLKNSKSKQVFKVDNRNKKFEISEFSKKSEGTLYRWWVPSINEIGRLEVAMLSRVPNFALCETRSKTFFKCRQVFKVYNRNKKFEIISFPKSSPTEPCKDDVHQVSIWLEEQKYVISCTKLSVISVGRKKEKDKFFGLKWQIWK